MMKKLVCAVLAAALTLTASVSAFAGSGEITVIVDGKTLALDVAPEIINDRTMVPMRAIFEALGAEVNWDGSARKITSDKDGTKIEMTIDEKNIYINGEAIALDAAPTIKNDRTLVPVRAVAEGLDAQVEWSGDTKTVIVLAQTKDTVVRASIDIKDMGEVSLLLFENVAPITVANFKKLANENFYDDLIFHRVIKGFMVQGGGFDDSLTQKKAEPIKGEFTSNGVENNLKHTRGVISMARTTEPDSASSQFFIMHEDTPSLDNEYAAFGIVTSGMEAVDKIAEMQTGTLLAGAWENLPAKPVYIKSVTIN